MKKVISMQRISRILIPSLVLFVISAFADTIVPAGTIVLKGEDFPVEKQTQLICNDSGACVHFVDAIKKTAQLKLSAPLGEKTLNLEIEVPATIGTHKIKLDKDGDQKPGEKFYLEIFGSNAAVDKVVYTQEDESDDATIIITDISEEAGTFAGTFSGKFFDGATGIKRVQVSGTILVK